MAHIYNDQQNARHFLRAMASVQGDPEAVRPDDCPESRWKLLLRQAGRSQADFSTQVNAMVRQPLSKRLRLYFAFGTS